jgi:hypothetical protein
LYDSSRIGLISLDRPSIPSGTTEHVQVMDKWLKDRKKRRLTFDEIRHYCGIATVLAKTLQIQAKRDEFYSRLEKSTFIPWPDHQ